jgi:hypothetical protein
MEIPDEPSLNEKTLAQATSCLPPNEEQLAKHYAGQFEWVLSLPVNGAATKDRAHSSVVTVSQNTSEDDKLYLGCNFVVRHKPQSLGEDKDENRPADTYTLLATPIQGDEIFFSRQSSLDQKPKEASSTSEEQKPHQLTATEMDAQESNGGTPRMTSEVVMNGKKDDIVEHVISLPPVNKGSRIEDSVDALDELEEQLEAINEVTQLQNILSPDPGSDATQVTKSATTVRFLQSQVEPGKASPGRKPVPGNYQRGSPPKKADGLSTTTSTPAKRAPGARPASLLPPKPLNKSNKTPTNPTFELPGEAVARRLKEKREARLSMQVTSEQAAALSSPAKIKSTKVPTRPTFELPGEAISRRKREEHERRLQQQREEERKRREFKARPIRNGTGANSVPRETVASRARQSKVTPTDKTNAIASNKRHSMAVMPVTSQQHLQLPARGRGSTVGSASTAHVSSRGTSASTASVGKRSTMSAEDMQHLKARGKEIYNRDNSIGTDRENVRREREEAAKIARQEAAERSRQLSREWADKHKLRA